MARPGGTLPAQRFDQLVEAFAGRPGVTAPGESRPRFGSSALKVDGSIFAMLTRDELVVKLPGARVAELVASGAGRPFDAGKRSPMKEWVVVAGLDVQDWRVLAEEALAFVGGSRGGP
ncbi:MAG TPA: TfoX/Sxy family protein [Kineosporiaceae bacterium]|nr:TfoX/Sxy family protein [Kineosporiaceae bacterium]